MDVTLTAPLSNAMTATVQPMRVEILEDWAAIQGLEAEWTALLQASNADTIFLTWNWIRCWIDALDTDIQPLVVCVRDAEGVLVGLAPLYRARVRLVNTVSYRVLRVMGDYPTGADYPDWIIRRDCDDTVTTEIIRALKARGGWDCIWMSNMAGWNGDFDRIVRASRSAGLHCATRPRAFSWFPLPTDKETYFQSLSKNKKQQLRAETKRIMHRPTVEILRCDNEDQISTFLNALFDLHSRRWLERGEAGAFGEQPREEAFYRRFVPEAHRQGWLRMYALRDGAELKAVQIGYTYRNVFHQLQEGFDPEYLKGVGNVLRARLIEDCIADGVEAYDFMGEMSEHKRRWLGQERTGHDLLIGRIRLKNFPLFNGFWPSCRFMRQVAPALQPARMPDR